MLTPLPADRWTYDAAAHLAVRAGFGAGPDELEFWRKQGLDKTLNGLLNAPVESVPAPHWANPFELKPLQEQVRLATTPEAKQAAQQTVNQTVRTQMDELIHWWTQEMTSTSAPLREKMVLFWHGHFATSAEKVRPPYRMWRQNQTFRDLAFADFGSMLKAVSRDPAMMVWLDIASSKKEHPNENFARELLELFSLGEGHYTEADIRAAAKAFTGYRFDPGTEGFRFVPGQFDASEKTFMQQAGPWDGDQIIDIVLKQQQCSRFLALKLCRFFVADSPDPKLVEALANYLYRNNYNLKATLRTLFSAQEFYSAQVYSAIIKSPVQLVVQARRTLDVGLPPAQGLQNVYRQLDQIPFYPPNVKGWDGGKSWINTATLTYRYNLAHLLVGGIRPEQVGMPKFPPAPKPVVANDTAPTSTMMSMASVSPNPSPSASPSVAAVPTPTPYPPVTVPWLVDRFVNYDERRDPRKLTDALTKRIFQPPPTSELVERFVELAASHPVPYDDKTIRDLAALMMSTPNYQLC